ncbi:hypothetical protein EON83_26545 [bacterium]|nr:MAG: hypothetical protein EON83_26545 [bacterium]
MHISKRHHLAPTLAILCLFSFQLPSKSDNLIKSLHIESPKGGVKTELTKVNLEWSDTQNAKLYKIVLVKNEEDLDNQNAETIVFSKNVQTGDVDTIRASIKVQSDLLKSENKYWWQVYVLNADGVVTGEAVNGPMSFSTTSVELVNETEQDESTLTTLANKGFMLGRTALDALDRKPNGKPSGKPAVLSFLSSRGERTSYRADFGLTWRKPPKTDKEEAASQQEPSVPSKSHWSFLPSIEGELADGNTESAKAIRTRLSWERLGIGPSLLGNSQLLISLKHETSQNYDNQKVGVEALLNPILLKYGIGRYIGKNIRYRWQPTFGIEGGSTIRGENSFENDYFRLSSRVRFDIRFNKLLTAKNGSFYVDNALYYLPLQNGKKTFNYVIVGYEYPLNDNVSFSLTYKNGRTAPQFDKVIRTLGGEIGLKF